jgi:hypothetical protein
MTTCASPWEYSRTQARQESVVDLDLLSFFGGVGAHDRGVALG